MSIFTKEPIRLIVQGITGKDGLFHAQKCAEYGTNVEEGRRILAESGLNLITAKDLKDAAEKVAGIVR